MKSLLTRNFLSSFKKKIHIKFRYLVFSILFYLINRCIHELILYRINHLRLKKKRRREILPELTHLGQGERFVQFPRKLNLFSLKTGRQRQPIDQQMLNSK